MINLTNNKFNIIIIVLCASLGLFFGMANVFYQVPFAALLFPAGLYLLGILSENKKKAMLSGFWCSTFAYILCMYWIYIPVNEFGHLPLYLALPCVFVLSAYMAIYGGVFSLCVKYLERVKPFLQFIMLGLIWYILEWFRDFILSGFPWIPLSSSFVPFEEFIQLASIIGSYGLSGVFAGIACLFISGALYFKHSGYKKMLFAVAILSLVFTFGSWRIDNYDFGKITNLQNGLKVGLVQGNIKQDQKWTKEYQKKTVNIYVALAQNYLDKHSGDLVIFPETAMPFLYNEHINTKDLNAFVRKNKVNLLFGAPARRIVDKKLELFNRAYLLDKNAKLLGSYDKEHLVPFGEYVPSWINLPFLKPLVQGVGSFIAGSKQLNLMIKPVSSQNNSDMLALGVLICYETIFPSLAQERVLKGANVLVNISNDAWFGKSSAPYQHLQMSVLRAVEQERYLARSTNTGISAIINPLGQIEVSGSLFMPEYVAGKVYGISERTIFNRIYDFITPFVFLSLFTLLYINRKQIK